jgi:D-glycero-D-manno-heptose 1,7-bisphosphate phosphatase
MKTLLGKEGAHLDGVFYCPHHPDQKCHCRKPETGLIEEAAKKLDIDCSRSYMVGDRRGDIEFASKVGARGILVLTGYGRGEWENVGGDWSAKPSYVAEDLYDAVQWILSQESNKNRKE